MRIQMKPDGAFDITTGSIALYNCYPGVNDRQLKTTNVEATKNRIAYHTAEGSLALTFDLSNSCLRITARYEGVPVRTLHILCSADVSGVNHYYRQGLGTGGPCEKGEIVAEAFASDRRLKAHGLLGLSDGETSLTLFAEDTGAYAQRSTLTYDITTELSRGWLPWTERTLKIDSLFFLENVERNSHTATMTILEHAGALDEAMRESAQMIASRMNARIRKEPLFHWCSWYDAYDFLDYDLLKRALEAARNANVPFSHFQVDAGYVVETGDWLEPNHFWPGGLERAFALIKEYGYQPGVWIAPFLVSCQSKLAEAHPDWILKDLAGKPAIALQCHGEHKQWHSLAAEYWVLDTTHPAAMEYIIGVFRTMRDWGARLFKTDFMSCGVWMSDTVKRNDPSITSVEALRNFLKRIRQTIGEESLWLGCIAPYAPFIGYADAMRIGGDVGAEWKITGHGPINMIKETKGSHYFNHIYWQNDPDAMMLRDKRTALTDREAESLTILQAISGGAVNTSEFIDALSPSRRELLSFVIPHGIRNPFYPTTEGTYSGLTIACHRLDDARYLIYLFNASSAPIRFAESLVTLINAEKCYLRRRHGEANILSQQSQSELICTVQPHEGQLYYVNTTEAITREPDNLWKW